MSRPAYPISCQCTITGQPPVVVQIARLVPFGGQFQVQGRYLFRALQTLEIIFTLPSGQSPFVEQVKVMKVFETLEGPNLPAAKRTMTVEFHFINLADEKRKELALFFEKIGQKIL